MCSFWQYSVLSIFFFLICNVLWLYNWDSLLPVSEVQWYIPAGLQAQKHHSATFLIKMTTFQCLEQLSRSCRGNIPAGAPICWNTRQISPSLPQQEMTGTGNFSQEKLQTGQHLFSLGSRDPFSHCTFSSAGARALLVPRCDSSAQLTADTLSCPHILTSSELCLPFFFFPRV